MRWSAGSPSETRAPGKSGSRPPDRRKLLSSREWRIYGKEEIQNPRPLLQGGGGAAYGYHLAGFEVVGVDIIPQPNYPYTFIQSDAIEYLRTHDLAEFDAIHASPPCQAHTRAKGLSKARNNGAYGNHPDFIPQTRELLQKIGKPYVIENVVGAPLIEPMPLSGTQFKNLYTQRKRLFESNIPLAPPEQKPVPKKTPPAGWGFGPDGFIAICGSGGVHGMNNRQIPLYWGFALGGIDWMTRDELAEAIPPAYTEFIGKQLITYLDHSGGKNHG